MKQVVEVAEIKRKIEKLVNSANDDFKTGNNSLYGVKRYVAGVLFSYLLDMACDDETWEDDMFRLNEWMDNLWR